MNKSEHWQKIINDCRASGLTKKVFCQQYDIKIHTLHYWLNKLSKKQNVEDGFIPFKPLGSKSSVSIEFDHAKIKLSINDVSLLLIELDQAGLLYDPA